MTFLPKLLAILAILLPTGSRESSEPTVLGSNAIHRAFQGQDIPDQFCFPTHLPSPGQSFFERLDESALDEEDSTIEDQGIVPPTFLDQDLPLANELLSSLRPTCAHGLLLIVTPILRC